MRFSGFHLSRDSKSNMKQHQKLYLNKFEDLPTEASISAFRSMSMRLAWRANTRSDCLFEISQLSQVTVERFYIERTATIRRPRKITKFTVDNHTSLNILKLEKESLNVIGFSDASFSSNYDLSIQICHVAFIADNKNATVPINFKFYKFRRVISSTIAR